jgi:gliding motility-associated lipoprotein GldH
MKRFFLLITIFTALLCTSCENKVVYNKYCHTSIEGWEKDDTLFFNVDSAKESGVYNEKMGLRINSAYPFVSLTVIVEQRSSMSKETKKDTLTCQTVDEKGVIRGHGTGNYQYDIPIGEIYLHQGEKLHLNIRHDMKRDILPGICDIGIEIAKR